MTVWSGDELATFKSVVAPWEARTGNKVEIESSTGLDALLSTRVNSGDPPDLAAAPGKEVVMLAVDYPPGGSTGPHRHNAQTFVYVLEGSVVMQVKGGPLQTLGPGQTFYEGPDDVHVVSKNASQTQPAKFLVVFVKDKGAPAVVPAP